MVHHHHRHPLVTGHQVSLAAKYIAHDIVAPVYKDIVKPLATLPVQFERDAAKAFENPSTILLLGGAVVVGFLLLRR